MANFDNKLNINNVRSAYTPNLKKEDAKVQPKTDDSAPEIVGDGTQAAESYGRILVKKGGKADSADIISSETLDFITKNPDIVARNVKSGDDAYELFLADGAEDAYEKYCCRACCGPDDCN